MYRLSAMRFHYLPSLCVNIGNYVEFSILLLTLHNEGQANAPQRVVFTTSTYIHVKVN